VTEFWPKKDDEVRHIVALFRHCASESSQITLSPEHSEFQWIDPETYTDLHRPGDEDV